MHNISEINPQVSTNPDYIVYKFDKNGRYLNLSKSFHSLKEAKDYYGKLKHGVLKVSGRDRTGYRSKHAVIIAVK
jgi:hypothetical protein